MHRLAAFIATATPTPSPTGDARLSPQALNSLGAVVGGVLAALFILAIARSIMRGKQT